MPRPREDSQALRALYRELVADHAPEIWRLAYRLCGERADADDLAQETYLEAWRSLPSLTAPSAGRAWLFRILTRRASRLWKQRKRRPQQLGDHAGSSATPDAVTYGAAAFMPARLEQLAEERTLRRALAGLSPDRRLAFLLVFQHGLSCQEAADLLGIPRGTVLSRIHRARHDLRAGLVQADVGPRRAGVER